MRRSRAPPASRFAHVCLACPLAPRRGGSCVAVQPRGPRAAARSCLHGPGAAPLVGGLGERWGLTPSPTSSPPTPCDGPLPGLTTNGEKIFGKHIKQSRWKHLAAGFKCSIVTDADFPAWICILCSSGEVAVGAGTHRASRKSHLLKPSRGSCGGERSR